MSPDPSVRRCAAVLNAFHSTLYFAGELAEEFGRRGLDDPMGVYLACRAAPLGAVGSGTVVAAFNAFAPGLVAAHLPATWRTVPPGEALTARVAAAGAALRRLLGDDVVAAPETREAAVLAMRAAEAGVLSGRPLYSANADLPVPAEPHLALWHAATLLREHRGDGHLIALGHRELVGLDALVTDCESQWGMPREIVMTKRGWTGRDWTAAQRRLRERGVLDEAGALTPAGARLRAEIEDETDRLDHAPYARLGPDGVARLCDLAHRLLGRAAAAFPAVLRDFFVPSDVPEPASVAGE